MILYTVDQIPFQVDEEDAEKVSLFQWRLDAYGYPCSKIGLLHHFLIGYPLSGLECDHKDRDKLNNQKDNLRYVTHQVNMRNRDLRSDNKTGYKGVYYRPAGPRNSEGYRAVIKIDNRQINLGHFKNLEDAVIARKNAEVLFGYE